MGKKNKSLPPDQDQRDLILSELGSNMLVEAAAGTGKTTSMVARMVALLRTGKCADIRTLSAVTFTRKAAAELRGRFQIALERAVRASKGKERKRLEQALERVEQCYVSTIHSFCGRLLRERPIEAGVDIGFTEIEPDEDVRLRRDAWSSFGATLATDDHDGLLAELDRLGLDLGALEETFVRFADYPDVDEWPSAKSDRAPVDVDRARKKLRGFLAHMRKLKPKLPDDWGTDKLIPAYRNLPRIESHYDLEHPAQMMELLARFDNQSKLTQKEWKKTGNFTADECKAEHARWLEFREEVVTPLFKQWTEQRYEPLMRVMVRGRAVYDELRRRKGQLNYQDLLTRAAGLLRHGPHVREYFARRFTHLLVDEFHDTDPIQAEVMLLLTATDPAENNWRRCVPRAGSLFVVGDPKQSIYRFRRADIVTYNEVKQIIAD
ncbi:MAG: UvrD-helicase domain-containing protein, partial [bacterium]|nr:UvrD-helicase domain-containing protein [bacterium]